MPDTVARLTCTSALGPDILSPLSLSGDEALSEPFSFVLEALSTRTIAAKDLLNSTVTVTLSTATGPRYFSGLVRRFSGGASLARDGRRFYRIEFVPWLWFLTQRRNYKIFQNKTALDIIKIVFAAYGSPSYQDLTQTTPPKRDYCVQYGESDFDFVCRLLEEEGVFYFFKISDGAHQLVLGDSVAAFANCSDAAATVLGPGALGRTVAEWAPRYEFRSGQFTHTDFNFETPSTNLLINTNTLVAVPGVQQYERYENPGDYATKADGIALGKRRMEEIEAGVALVDGLGSYEGFAAGTKIAVSGSALPAGEAGAYTLVAVRHTARSDGFYLGDQGGDDYSNSFVCMPAATVFRPPRVVAKPRVAGPQTAFVVGPAGEEIYIDAYGRVKVQFIWDRDGKKNENSSCWIRVAQSWGGKNWGFFGFPRIGSEVVVSFLDGDPDRPLIIGCVYNAEQTIPYARSDMNKTGVKTRSTKQGGDSNYSELRFDDTKGSEQVFFHAEKDFSREVENDDALDVQHDRTITIKNNLTQTVDQGDETETLNQGNRSVTLKMGDDALTLSQGNRSAKLAMGNDALELSMGNQSTKLSLGASTTEAMQSITLKVGQNSVVIDQTGVTIKGLMISIQGQVQTEVKGLMTQVSGDAMLTVKGAITMIN